jgi:Ribose/xylose/arabinose/galactoside ABC-type transport systems, permease components
MNRLLKQHEFYAALLLVAIIAFISISNPSFYSLGNIFSLAKSSIGLGIFSLGVLLVLISGGIDISFPAIAMFAMYLTSRSIANTKDVPGVSATVSALMLAGVAAGVYAIWTFARPPRAVVVVITVLAAGVVGFLVYRYLAKAPKDTSIYTIFLIGMAMGAGLGCINAALIALFRLPTFVVSLGTTSAFAGFVHNFVGTKVNYNIPSAMTALSRWEIVTVNLESGGRVGLSGVIFVFIGFAVLTAFILNKTMLGRGIYALGGDPISAERVGLKVKSIQFFIFPFVGMLAGAAGIIHSSFMRNSRSTDLLGTELNVIAAVVLGGAGIGGGKGTVLGTLIGVVLITIVNNSLILMGISSFWQKVTTGAIVILAIGIPAVAKQIRERGRI